MGKFVTTAREAVTAAAAAAVVVTLERHSLETKAEGFPVWNVLEAGSNSSSSSNNNNY